MIQDKASASGVLCDSFRIDKINEHQEKIQNFAIMKNFASDTKTSQGSRCSVQQLQNL